MLDARTLGTFSKGTYPLRLFYSRARSPSGGLVRAVPPLGGAVPPRGGEQWWEWKLTGSGSKDGQMPPPSGGEQMT